jgi:molybdopterin synthase catalytic subunit
MIRKDQIWTGLFSNEWERDKALEFVQGEGFGALVVFEGHVRNKSKGSSVVRLEFEAYEAMAMKEMEKIALSAMATFGIGRICLFHRTGVLGIGEVPVLIAVSSVHRGEAFAACQFAIDTLKKDVPIWKKEVTGAGEEWVSDRP